MILKGKGKGRQGGRQGGKRVKSGLDTAVEERHIIGYINGQAGGDICMNKKEGIYI